MVSLDGHTHMQSIAVGVAIDGHRRESKIATRADDTYSNFPSIGNQYFLKWPGRGSGSKCLHRGSFVVAGSPFGDSIAQIGRASCRKECRYRLWPYQLKKNKVWTVVIKVE